MIWCWAPHGSLPRREEGHGVRHGSILLCHTVFVLLWAPQRRAKGTEEKGKSLMRQWVLYEGPGRLLTLNAWSCFWALERSLQAPLCLPWLRLSRWSQWVPTAGGRPQGPLSEASPSCSSLFLETSQLGHGRPLPPSSHPANSLPVVLLSPFSLLFLGWGCPARLVLL